jgi:hypothetical protein
MQKAASMEVAVGFPAGKAQAYPDGESVIDVAARNCFGIGVPQRDFMELAKPDIAEKAKPIIREMGRIAVKPNPGIGEVTAVQALQEAAGQVAQTAIQKAIIDLDTPPNAPATIAAKGSSNPLVDTGHLKNAVTFVVRERKPQ